MPRIRHIFANGLPYTATEHDERDDGLRQPQYVLNCQAKARLAKMGETPKHFYFGYNQTTRISFEMEGTWWYIDNQVLYDLLNNLEQFVIFNVS